jgi:hypothetical protein
LEQQVFKELLSKTSKDFKHSRCLCIHAAAVSSATCTTSANAQRETGFKWHVEGPLGFVI